MKIEQMYHGGGGYNRKTNDNLGAFNEQKSIEKKQIDCKNHNLHTIDDESNDCVIDKISLIECSNFEPETVSCTKEIRYETKSTAHSTKLSKCATKESKTANKLRITLVSVLLFFSICLFALFFIYMPLNEQKRVINQVTAADNIVTGNCGVADSSGNPGSNVTYSWNKTTYALTISGTGAMYDYESYASPFYQSASITTITINSGVTSIGNFVFEKCLTTSATIPNSVTSIGEGAFCECDELTSITIPNSVTSIGAWAFCECDELTSITIPASVTSIGYYAFESCSGLTSVKYIGTIEKWCGIQFSDSSSNPLSCAHDLYINNTKVTNLEIPASVTKINAYAFYNCSDLTSVTIESGVTSIGASAFQNCSGLTSVTIPASVTSIGSWAFNMCSGLTSITINGKNTTIGSSAIPANTGMIIYGHAGSTAQTYATNKNITFQVLKTTTTITFQVSFANETPKGGIFIYILRDNESGSGYAEFYSYYCDGESNNQSIVYELSSNATYRVVISKPYVWDFSISGTGFSNTSFVNNKFTFTTTSNVGVVTIGTTGGTPPNTFTVI